jgi:hypothetical protein
MFILTFYRGFVHEKNSTAVAAETGRRGKDKPLFFKISEKHAGAQCFAKISCE